MADIQVIHPPNGGKTFWSDLSKKGGTWAGVATAGAAACAVLGAEEGIDLSAAADTKHVLIGLGIAALRAVLGLAQGKTGNPATAKFDKAPVSDADPDIGG